jgi:hypothetical protein
MVCISASLMACSLLFADIEYFYYC